MQRIFYTFAMLQENTSEGASNNTKMQQPVSGMHIAHVCECNNRYLVCTQQYFVSIAFELCIRAVQTYFFCAQNK